MSQLTVEYQFLSRWDHPPTPSRGRSRTPCARRWGRGSGKRGRGRRLLDAGSGGSLGVLGAPLAPRLLLAADDGHPDTASQMKTAERRIELRSFPRLLITPPCSTAASGKRSPYLCSSGLTPRLKPRCRETQSTGTTCSSQTE